MNKNAKKVTIIIAVLLLVLMVFGVWSFKQYNAQQEKLRIEKENQERLLLDISDHYNKYVLTTELVKIYRLVDGEYVESGSIQKNQTLELKDVELTYQTTYLELADFEGCYVYYKDVIKTSKAIPYNDRYKKYIPFNENIITNSLTNFYDEDGTLVYSIDSSYTLPIIIKDTTRYGVDFNNRLLFVNKEDVKIVSESTNTDKTNTGSIAVLNYHFFYDASKLSERQDCDQIICISTSLFEEHLKYIKNNNIFTPTLNELEMYLDKKIKLPKSVVITIDDGWRTEPARDLLEKYQLNGTVFLITSWFKEVTFIHDFEYVEFHSHGENLHNQGVCPGGQGGAIKCLEKSKLLNDLATTRKKLENTKYFCYPFYEYNSYSISVLKEAGFTMAFGGGFRRAYPGIDKYQIPRYVMYIDTSVADLKSYIG